MKVTSVCSNINMFYVVFMSGVDSRRGVVTLVLGTHFQLAMFQSRLCMPYV